ncbi:MAG: 30S ribosomal protein S17 [Candidatus Latescibacteria bacterium]|nr:30S ribosomal protein S17 [Candidatus Latescibacterota bacterium]
MSTGCAKRGQRKVRVGRVVSDKAQKTIVVEIERLVRHPLYQRTIKRRTTLVAHDAEDTAHVGDLVRVVETRPLSKTKHWRLVNVIERVRL